MTDDEIEREVFLHAACLSIAEGVSGWDKPLTAWGDSPATDAVRRLRAERDALRATLAEVTRERDEALQTITEMRGTPDERAAGIRRRGRVMIERDPVAALTNVATALALGEIEEAVAVEVEHLNIAHAASLAEVARCVREERALYDTWVNDRLRVTADGSGRISATRDATDAALSGAEAGERALREAEERGRVSEREECAKIAESPVGTSTLCPAGCSAARIRADAIRRRGAR